MRNFAGRLNVSVHHSPLLAAGYRNLTFSTGMQNSCRQTRATFPLKKIILYYILNSITMMSTILATSANEIIYAGFDSHSFG